MDPVDRLYSLPLEEFTAARNQLAKELRAAGERERADEVKALRKPSQAAWALNQAARREAGAVAELLHAGRRLRRAQEDLVARGGKRDELRAAVDAQRAAVDSLVTEASASLASPSAQLRDRIRATVHAAAGDDRVAELLQTGRLSEDHRAVGLGPLGGMAPAEPQRGRTKKAVGKRRPKADGSAAREAERERKRRIAETRKRAARAQRDAEKAARELASAADARERAEAAFSAAQRAQEEARARAEAAEEEAQKLRAELEGLTGAQ